MKVTPLYNKYFNKKEWSKPYGSTYEYLSDLLYTLNVFIQIATATEDTDSAESYRYELEKMGKQINNRLSESETENRLSYIFKTFHLNEFEKFCMLMALSSEAGEEYGNTFMRLQNSENDMTPQKGLAIWMYQLLYVIEADDLKEFLTDSGVMGKYCLETDESEGKYTDAIRLEPDIKFYLLYERSRFTPQAEGVVLYPSKQAGFVPQVHQIIRERIKRVMNTWNCDFKMKQYRMIQLYGREGTGRSYLVKQVVNEKEYSIGALASPDDCSRGTNIIFYDISDLAYLNKRQWCKKVYRLFADSVLAEAVICITLKNKPEELCYQKELKYILEYILDHNQIDIPFSFIFFITEDSSEELLGLCKDVIRVEIPMPNAEEKNLLWKEYSGQLPLNEELPIEELAVKYILTPKDIKNVLHTALLYAYSGGEHKIGDSHIVLAVRQRQQEQMGNAASLINSVFTWEDLILEERQKKMLHLICNQIKYRDVVGEEWGFYEKMPYGRGVSVLFYGSPGTGKTMAAQVIANELGLDLYRIDLSQIISKYIGETEKNISELFEKAEDINAILFFDEADALFAKRSGIKDSNDRNANSMTAHLLQKIENYEGISILATNLIHNMDDAFKRRIKYVVQFVFPEKKERFRLFQKMIPAKAHMHEKLDFEFFAEKFELSGSSIKEVMLNAAFLAAGEGVGIGNRHIAEAIKLHYLKYEKILSSSDFGYYGDD